MLFKINLIHFALDLSTALYLILCLKQAEDEGQPLFLYL